MRGLSCQQGVHGALVRFEVVDAAVVLAGELRMSARAGSGDEVRTAGHVFAVHLCPSASVSPPSPDTC